MRNVFFAGLLILMGLPLPAKADNELAEFKALKPEIALLGLEAIEDDLPF